MVEEGDDLSSCHFDVFDIARCDVGLVGEWGLSEVLGILGVDADDGVLGG